MVFYKNLNLSKFLLRNIKKIFIIFALLALFIPYKNTNNFINSLTYGFILLFFGETLRILSLSSTNNIKRVNNLLTNYTTNNLYTYLRNPLFLSNIIIITAITIILGARFFAIFTFISFFTFYNIISSYEEYKLLKYQGKDYYRYMKTIRRWIPSFYIKLSQSDIKYDLWKILLNEKIIFKTYLLILSLAIIKQIIIIQIYKFF